MNQRISWMLALTAAGMPARVPRSVRLPRAGKAAARMQQPAEFGRARAACLEGRGYTVK